MHASPSLSRSVLLALSLLSGCAAANADSAAMPPPAPIVGGNAGDYLTGRWAAMENDLPAAARQFGAALQREPDNPELQQQAFLANLMAGTPEAVKLAVTQPDNQAAQMLLADDAAQHGDWAKAEAGFAALSTQGMSQILQPMLVAWAQQGAGRTDAALATLKPFAEGQRFRAVYALHAALIADLAGRQDDAARLYPVAQADYGTPNLQLSRMVASWQARTGHEADARDTLAALTRSSPDLAIALRGLQAAAALPAVRNPTDGMAEAYLALAAALRMQNANEYAVVMIRLALDLRPDFPAAVLLQADIDDSTHHPQSALTALATIPASDPLDPVARLRRAVLADRAGDAAAALAGLRQMIVDYPDRPEPPALEGDILRSQHHYAEAVTAYDRAVSLLGTPAAQNWPLFYDRGIALERADRWPQAEADFQKALELQPNQPAVMNYLGYSWAERGENLDRARAMIEQAAQQRPTDGAILDSLGWVLLRLGDTRRSLQFLERAVELDSEDSTINGHLGDAYWTVGRKREARFQWHRAATLNPEPDEAVKLQARLRDGDLALRALPVSTPATASPAASPAAPPAGSTAGSPAGPTVPEPPKPVP